MIRVAELADVILVQPRCEGCIIGGDRDFDNKRITYLPAGVSLDQMTELMNEARALG